MPALAPEIVIIANPTSGHGAAERFALEVLHLLKAAGKPAELRLTQASGDAEKIAREARDAGTRIVAGCCGDGTLQEIVNALSGSECAMAVLPHGRCNDFARALNLFREDSAETLTQMLLAGKRTPIDVGQCEATGPDGQPVQRLFCTVATLGFDTHVSRFVETNRLPLKGTLAYLYGVLKVLWTFQPFHVRLTGDFGVLDEKIVLAATGNTPCYGGAMQIAPGARPDDGLFQLCVVKAMSRVTILRVLPKVFWGTHVKHPSVNLLQTSQLQIETPSGPEWICADGETLGQTPVRLKILPKKLFVITKN